MSAESIYLAGRNIGDEYRYVLDRRLQKKFPGNMLERPALLLNPWVLRSTETGEQLARAGEEYERMLKESGGSAIKTTPANGPARTWGAGGEGDFADIDFLYDTSATLVNLVPDKEGVVKIPRKDLGAHAMIHVLAVDPINTTARSLSLPETKTDFVDLRLRNGLDPNGHFTQQKQVNVLSPKQPFVIADAAASRFEVYDSLAKVYGLYATLTHDPKLAEFSFILTWPTLKLEEKKTLYSKFACHELSFFLAKKDPEFFQNVVKPYLANKKDKTFVDHWLLENDLKEYLQPWQHARLNSVERILLAQRLDNEAAKTARHLNDLVRLLPPNLQRERMLFETAVKAGEMTRGEKSAKGMPHDPESRARLMPKKEEAPREAAGIQKPHSDSEPSLTAGSSATGRATGGEADMLRDRKRALARDGRTRGEDKDVDEAAKKELGDLNMPVDAEQFFMKDDRAGKDAPARLYRKLDPTLELAENNYFKLPIQQQLAALVGVSDFWVDYARHDAKALFLSRNLADASRNFTEMMLALAVLDLPFAPGKNDLVFNNGKLTFTPGGIALMFHEEVKPVAGLGDKVQILVSQNFYRHGDRYKDENGERLDKFVTDEFVIQTVYGCQVVVTNPTPLRQRH